MRDVEEDQERFFWGMIVVALIFFLFFFLSYKRRNMIGPKVCQTMCQLREGEDFYTYNLTDFGLFCMCRPGPKYKKPPVIVHP